MKRRNKKIGEIGNLTGLCFESGYPEYIKEELWIFPKDTDKVEFYNGMWFHKEE